jgi:hypothetical protein
VTATPGVNSLTVSWSAPGDVGAGLDSYTATAMASGYPDKSCTATAPDTSCTITGLAAGVSYSLEVISIGPGGESKPAEGEPTGPPTGTPAAPAEVPDSVTPSSTGTATLGATVTISGSGYKAGSTVVLTFYSTPVSAGSATVSSGGTFSATVTVPAGVGTGSHTLLATGLDASGNVKFTAKAVTVAAAAATSPATSTTGSSTTAASGAALPITGVNMPRLLVAAFTLFTLGLFVVAATDERLARRLRRWIG